MTRAQRRPPSGLWVRRDLLPRLEAIALAGATSMKTTFVGGQKSLPVRYTLAAAG